MSTNSTHNVEQIPTDEKRMLEQLLGSPLHSDQNVLILTYTPGQVPDDIVRQAARERIAHTIAVNQQFAANVLVTAEETDAAIEEAFSQVRPRR